MSVRGLLIAGLLAACAAGPAFAQVPPPPAADPIDALLRQKPVDPEEPDTAATGSSAVEPDPVVPPTYVPRAPLLKEPVFLHETGKAPDGPPTPADQAYDERLRASASAVRAFQGPMEGGWALTAGGRDLYVLQLIDRGGWVDGAWRDVRRPGAPDGSGFIEGIQRTATGDLTFRFAAGIVAVLHPSNGRWSGQLTEAGRTETVTLKRRGP
jgi:hypothetical protein